MKRLLQVILVLVWVVASPVFASSVNPAHVAADAVWVAHGDAEKIMTLPLMSECPVMSGANPKLKERLAALIAKTGMDPRRDIRGVTVYATKYEGDVGVAIVYLSHLEKEKLVAFLKEKRPEAKTEAVAGHTLYTWNMRCMRRSLEVTGTFVDEATMVIGADQTHVLAALEVLAGSRPSLKPGHDLLKGSEAGTLWFANAIKVPVTYRQDTRCPVLRQCQSASARWWFQDEILLGRYTLQAINAETATLLSQAIDGFKALFALRFNGQEPMMKLLTGFSQKADGTALTVSWRGSFDDIRAAARYMREQHQKPGRK